MPPTNTLTVSCLCGAATHTFAVPTSSLPLPSQLCNCTTSRRISGSLLTSYINITHDPDSTSSSPQILEQSKPDLSRLTPYPSSDILTRWFCATCGTHMYLEYLADGHFEAATGTLDNVDGIVQFESCMWIGDTIEGGASQFITHIDSIPLKRYLQSPRKSPEIPLHWKDASCTATNDVATERKKGEKVRATCHCGGVQFYISPPDARSQLATSPYPDLMVPYHGGPSAAANPENHAWWIVGGDRFLAGTCACSTCRRASGFDVTFWGFVPTSNITLDAEGEIPFTRNGGRYWGAMKSYRSSERVTRTFCGKCGANVFWDGDERLSIVDVAVGLLDAKEGARAEGLLGWWYERVSFEEEALNKELIRGLSDGLRDWGRMSEEKGKAEND
ncbi:unnamed protein product [Periconia digitata]|uniref:CENP-V/GFA domain-containing protein n=1 Tax=Periconia digitata TaxID=1303443 RepID=A0A9W4U719_9PLEO|nr:unnamed protein product [Periconia digitata]